MANIPENPKHDPQNGAIGVCCVVGYHKLLAFVKVKLSQESAKSAKVHTRQLNPGLTLHGGFH